MKYKSITKIYKISIIFLSGSIRRNPETLNKETTLLINFTNENPILTNAYIVIEISNIE